MSVAVVLGASGGLGSAIAALLAKDHRVIGTHHGPSHPEIAGVVWKQLDMNSVPSIESFCKELTSVDVLVNTIAAPLTLQRFEKLAPSAYEADLRVNVLNPLLLVQTLLPKLSKNACVVFTLTEMLDATPAYFSSYVISKHALLGLVKALDAELKDVRVNAVSPGMMDTRYIGKLPAFVKEKYAKARGLVEPEDVAQAVKKLIDSDARGEVVRV